MKVELRKDGKTLAFDSVRELAEYLQISVGLLYNHFKENSSFELDGMKITKTKEEDEIVRQLREKRKEKRTVIPEYCWKEEESETEIRKRKKYEHHLSKTCVRSIDDKFWIPRSLLEEIPQLRFLTMPKAMSV